ncbi:hypothetical protein, partial [Actinoplanes sp. NPDC049599]|uniref:hypothetical protein n=1 Tax=Actinoplanes sp. NPDC049599 TaxID=3363903 RepID=UPI0037AACE80
MTIRIAVGLSVAAVAAVSLTPVATALPHAFGGGQQSALADVPAPLVGTGSKGAIAGEYLVMLKDQAGLQAAGVEGSGDSAQTLVADAVERGEDAGATV